MKQLEAEVKRQKFERLFDVQCRAERLPPAKPEFTFHPTRGWRFDRAWPDLKIAVEIDGGVYAKGRHTRGAGFEEDCIKCAEALLLGWTVYRFSTGQVQAGVAIDFMKRAVEARTDRQGLTDELMKRYG